MICYHDESGPVVLRVTVYITQIYITYNIYNFSIMGFRAECIKSHCSPPAQGMCV